MSRCPTLAAFAFSNPHDRHPPAGRLADLTDLMFNIQYEAKTWLTKWVFRMVGTWRRPMQSRVWRLITRDKASAAASIGRILDWDSERLILAHGSILTKDARETLTSAVWWMLSHRALSV
jgi:hypothetical protein